MSYVNTGLEGVDPTDSQDRVLITYLFSLFSIDFRYICSLIGMSTTHRNDTQIAFMPLKLMRLFSVSSERRNRDQAKNKIEIITFFIVALFHPEGPQQPAIYA